MKIEDCKKGMRVKLINTHKENTKYVRIGDTGTVCYDADGPSVEVKWDNPVDTDCNGEWFVQVKDLEPAQPFPLANTKINVQKYAEENGISLEQAHKEVQEWLFEQGGYWFMSQKEVRFDHAFHVYFAEDGDLTWTGEGNRNNYFQEHENKEIILSRKITVELTPSFVKAEEPAVEYVELGGKRYVKSELEEALSKIKAVEE